MPLGSTYLGGGYLGYGPSALQTYYFFTPPLVQDRPTFLPDSSTLQKELWRHFERRYRGVNVWLLSDGSIVQDTSTPENSNVDMSAVYPWNINDATAPYVRAIYLDAGATVPTSHDTAHAVYPTAFFAGGSTYQITSSQYSTLVNYTTFGAGYAGRIT